MSYFYRTAKEISIVCDRFFNTDISGQFFNHHHNFLQQAGALLVERQTMEVLLTQAGDMVDIVEDKWSAECNRTLTLAFQILMKTRSVL